MIREGDESEKTGEEDENITNKRAKQRNKPEVLKKPQETSTMSQIISAKFALITALISLGLLACLRPQQQQVEASIGYFEDYGWPTYGIVKPFWMTPFSAFPSRSISGYSRKHTIYNGRGVLNYRGY